MNPVGIWKLKFLPYYDDDEGKLMLSPEDYLKRTLAALGEPSEDNADERMQAEMMAGSLQEFLADGTTRTLTFLPDSVTDELIKSEGIEVIVIDGKRHMADGVHEWKVEGDALMIKDRNEDFFNVMTDEKGPWRKANADDGTITMAEGMMIFAKA